MLQELSLHNWTYKQAQQRSWLLKRAPFLCKAVQLLCLKIRLFIPVKRSLTAFPSGNSLPELLKDMAICIATEDPAAEPCNTGSYLHSSVWPATQRGLLVQGEFFFADKANGAPTIVLAWPAMNFSQDLSFLRGDFHLLATSARLTLSGPLLELPRDLGCCRKICPTPYSPACGKASLQGDVVLYPKGNVYHIP